VSLELFDVAGRRVAVRNLGVLGPGSHSAPLTGSEALPSGIYLVRMTAGGTSIIRRGVLLR
jgi:hypothetical protein